MSSILFFPIRGAASRVSPEATAFPHRRGYHMGIYSLWTDPAQNDQNIAWVRETWTAIQPFVAGGVYVNELGEDEGGDRVQMAYGPNYDRLAADQSASTTRRTCSASTRTSRQWLYKQAHKRQLPCLRAPGTHARSGEASPYRASILLRAEAGSWELTQIHQLADTGRRLPSPPSPAPSSSVAPSVIATRVRATST